MGYSLRGTRTAPILNPFRSAVVTIMDCSQIITIDPGKRSGKSCIRGLRITVYDVLDYLGGDDTRGDSC